MRKQAANITSVRHAGLAGGVRSPGEASLLLEHLLGGGLDATGHLSQHQVMVFRQGRPEMRLASPHPTSTRRIPYKTTPSPLINLLRLGVHP